MPIIPAAPALFGVGGTGKPFTLETTIDSLFVIFFKNTCCYLIEPNSITLFAQLTGEFFFGSQGLLPGHGFCIEMFI
jgi:hypothetical protein